MNNIKKQRGLRTYRLKDFLNNHFGVMVRKMPLHSNLGCPHRDSTVNEGGCIFCYEPGFSFMDNQSQNTETQIESVLQYAERKGYQGKFMAYFQTGTNTYADRNVLESLWKPILEYPDKIVAMAIGTRPDCLSLEAIDLLKEMSSHLMVWVELGLQSIHNRTLQHINRGHDYQTFEKMVFELESIPNLYVCAHIILGLPGETKGDMLKTIHQLNSIPVDGVKFHHLQIPKHTKLETLYKEGKIKVYTIHEYVNLITDLLPHLSSQIVVHRLTGEIKNDLLVAPRWPLPKVRVVQLIEEMLRKKRVVQGDFEEMN